MNKRLINYQVPAPTATTPGEVIEVFNYKLVTSSGTVYEMKTLNPDQSVYGVQGLAFRSLLSGRQFQVPQRQLVLTSEYGYIKSKAFGLQGCYGRRVRVSMTDPSESRQWFDGILLTEAN